MAVLNNDVKGLKNDHFIRVLFALRKRPGMYLSPINLTSLRNFICGYQSHGLFSNDDADVLSSGENNFYCWMADKEGMKLGPAMGWVEMLNNKYDQDAAFNKFFIYLEQWLDAERKDE